MCYIITSPKRIPMDEIIPIRTRALNIRSRVDAAAPQQSSSKGTVFFIHGAMATLTQFDAQMACLLAEDQWNFVAYDHFGCGKSPRLEDSFYSYSTEEHFLDLLHALECTAAKLKSPIVLEGYEPPRDER